MEPIQNSKFLCSGDITHFYINKKFYESPRAIRKKILAAETSRKRPIHGLNGQNKKSRDLGEKLYRRETKSANRPIGKPYIAKNFKILTKRSAGDESCYYTNHEIMSTINNGEEDENDYQFPATHARNFSQDSNYFGNLGPIRMMKD